MNLLLRLCQRNRQAYETSPEELGLTTEEFLVWAKENHLIVQQSANGFMVRYDHPPLFVPVRTPMYGKLYLIRCKGVPTILMYDGVTLEGHHRWMDATGVTLRYQADSFYELRDL